MQEIVETTGVTNNAGGAAVLNSPEWVLTKLVTTGMTTNTFYVKSQNVQDQVLAYAREVKPEFLAKLIVYARRNALMRDNPVMLTALLSTIDPVLFHQVFPKTVLTGRDLKNFARVIDSGLFRKGFGTSVKKQVAKMLSTMDAYQFIKYNGDNQRPSMKDIVKMAHPKVDSAEQTQLFRWVLNKDFDKDQAPQKLKALLRFKQLKNTKGYDEAETVALLETTWIPENVATSYKLTENEWLALAGAMPLLATIKLLRKMANTGLFANDAFVAKLAGRLSNAEAVRRSRVMPYDIMRAYLNTSEVLPQALKNALGAMLEVSTSNVPEVVGNVRIAMDISTSMRHEMAQPGAKAYHGRAAFTRQPMRYIDVGAMVASAVLRKNPTSELICFNTEIQNVPVDANDTIFTNSQKISAAGGGGTDVSAPFKYLLEKGLATKTDLFICITDNESWFSSKHAPFTKTAHNATEAAHLWGKLREQNPGLKGIMINLTPYETDQMPENLEGVTMISGFSDEVFKLIDLVVNNGLNSQVERVMETEL